MLDLGEINAHVVYKGIQNPGLVIRKSFIKRAYTESFKPNLFFKGNKKSCRSDIQKTKEYYTRTIG